MQEKQINPFLKLLLELGPLIVFFLVNARMGLFWATGAFMAAITVSLVATYILERKVAVMPLVTGGFVLVFGGLTLILQDELFIKLKPTLVNVLFAAILVSGLLSNRLFLKMLLSHVMPLRDAGWRLLTWRWVGFFLLLAILNEIVWRNFTTDQWVNFKVFGIMPLTLAFSLLQLPTMNRFRLEEPEGEDAKVENAEKRSQKSPAE